MVISKLQGECLINGSKPNEFLCMIMYVYENGIVSKDGLEGQAQEILDAYGLSKSEYADFWANIETYEYLGVTLSGRLIIEEGINRIGNWSFHAMGLSAITFPDSLKELGIAAFYMGRLTDLALSDLDVIENNAFENNKLVSVTLNNIKEIGEDAFEGYEEGNQIENLTIDGTEIIKYGAFRGNQIKNLTIPSSVTTIENSAFEYNPLESITILGSDSQRFNSNWTYIGFPSNLMP